MKRSMGCDAAARKRRRRDMCLCSEKDESFIIVSVQCPAAVRVSHLFLADLSRGWKNTAVTPPSDIQFPSMSLRRSVTL